MRKDWETTKAKRMIADAALRLAVAEMDKAKAGAGFGYAYHSSSYRVVRALAQHAAEQLRLSDGGK